MNEMVSTTVDAAVRYLLVGSIAAAVLVPLAWLVLRAARLRAPVHRHAVWFYCLIGTALLPALWLHGPKLKLPVLPAPRQLSPVPARPQPVTRQTPVGGGPVLPTLRVEDAASPAIEATPSQNQATTPRRAVSWTSGISWRVVAAGVWLAGFTIMLIRLAVGWLRLCGICRRARSVEPQVLSDRTLDVRLTDGLEGPVCFGLWRPVILLPEPMYRETSAGDLRMILAHELAHIDRRDAWVNLLQRLLEAAFFFHSLVRLASRQLTHERERLCDNCVLAGGASVDDYMQLLSNIGERILMKTGHTSAVALFEGGLLSRVRSLLDPQHSRVTRMTRRSAWTFAMMSLLCFAATGTIRLGARPNPGVPPMAATMLAGGVGQVDANDTSVRPQEETLGPTGRRPNGNCSLGGTVVSDTTGEPIGHATTYLFSTDTHDAIFIRVASDGSFLFKDIAAGNYAMRTTNTAGYQDVSYNPENQAGNFRQFTLKEGERRTGIILRARPACNISGVVLDERGAPLTGQLLWVVAWQAKEADGSAGQFANVGQVPVTSTGAYTLDGLDARPTYVMAVDFRSELKDDYYPPCYYPGTLDRAKATVIAFDKGESVENADIRLARHGDQVLEGTITDASTGRPIENALVVVHHMDMLFDQITAYTDAQGRYRLDTVTPGEAIVHVDAKPFGYVRKRQTLTLDAGTKETRLDLSLTPGVTLTGKFVDTAGKDVEFTWMALGYAYHRPDLNPGGPSWSGSNSRYSVVQGDGQAPVFFMGGSGDYSGEIMDSPTPSTFRIDGVLPGQTLLTFDPKAPDLTVQSINYEGRNIMPDGFTTSLAQREVKDVTIVLARPQVVPPR